MWLVEWVFAVPSLAECQRRAVNKWCSFSLLPVPFPSLWQGVRAVPASPCQPRTAVRTVNTQTAPPRTHPHTHSCTHRHTHALPIKCCRGGNKGWRAKQTICIANESQKYQVGIFPFVSKRHCCRFFPGLHGRAFAPRFCFFTGIVPLTFKQWLPLSGQWTVISYCSLVLRESIVCPGQIDSIWKVQTRYNNLYLKKKNNKNNKIKNPSLHLWLFIRANTIPFQSGY